MTKKLIALALAGMLLVGCAIYVTSDAADTTSAQVAAAETANMFTDRDFEVGYSDCVTVTLADGGSESDGKGVSIDGDTITIMQEGTFLLTGALSNGQIVINVPNTSKVQLVLSGASVSCDGSAALYIKEADKVFLTLAENSENTLSSTGEFVQTDSNNVDGAIFSKADLTMNGGGALDVSCESGHGIVSKDDLKVTSGSYSITSASQGLSGKDSVRIAGGTFAINSGKDGVHSSNTDDISRGFVYISGGTFDISSGGDGVDASCTLTVLGGTFNIVSGGGSANAAEKTEEWPGMGRWDGTMPDSTAERPQGAPPDGSMTFDSVPQAVSGATPPEQAENIPDAAESSASSQSTDTGTDTVSTKGLKSDAGTIISGGTFNIDSQDDALHTNADMVITGGELTLSSGDDGIHADGALTVSGGTIDIIKSYEGLEGATISVEDGVISVVSSDDGLNASGSGSTEDPSAGAGMMGMADSDESAVITISGGRLTVDAQGDGIDSNGSIIVSGGSTYVNGPTTSANGALDYGSTGTVSGGVVIAAGSAGMAQNFGSDSTQGAILYTLSSAQEAGTTVILADSDGNILASYAPTKQFQSVVISAPGIVSGKTYTLTVGSVSETIEMTDIIYGSGFEMGGGFGGGGQKDKRS